MLVEYIELNFIFSLYFIVRNTLLSFWKCDEIENYEIYGINKIK
jgi:hypothetical protein